VNFTNAPGTNFVGGQGFNLGGRSMFWGGLIPRMTWWELEPWPQQVRWYLENTGYQRAEDLMYWPASPSTYQQQFKALLRTALPDHDHFDAPVAVRQLNPSFGTIPSGLFSTADLLTESKLTDDPAGNERLSVNLNHAVTRIETAGGKATRVIAYDLLVRKERAFSGKIVVLAAGTIESAKIAKLSGLADPNGQIGAGITDHPIFFTHFVIPQGAPHHSTDSQSKTLSRHKQANRTSHPYNIVIELGADLNQGRYVDPDLLRRHQQLKGNAMLCEIVFLFDADLMPQNRLDQYGPSYVKPVITMQPSPSADAFWAEVNGIKDLVIADLGGEPILGSDLTLKRAGIGGVAHEVGTLRMGGVVDENLKFNAYDNLYACDLSVFPTSPAANPTLTLAALSLRLAEHLKTLL
jgi:choline dehydrogenase-like flavoprotein